MIFRLDNLSFQPHIMASMANFFRILSDNEKLKNAFGFTSSLKLLTQLIYHDRIMWCGYSFTVDDDYFIDLYSVIKVDMT